MELKKYSLGEEIANSCIHGTGFAFGIVALTLLVTLASLFGDVWRIVSFSIYGASLILLYLFSTLYHTLQHEKTKKVFRILDHCAIFLLIAGTYTPFTLVSIRHSGGIAFCALIWSFAVLGIILTSFFIGKFKKLELSVYLIMGWLAVFVLGPLIDSLPTAGIVLIFVGGLAYSLGTFFYVSKKVPYNHAIWHVFVLSGSVCHFVCIFLYVLPMNSTEITLSY